MLCKWQRCWVGPGPEIQRLERELKKHYRHQILNEGLGYTEWVSGLTWEDVVPMVQDMIEGHRFKVEPVPMEFMPLSSRNLDAYRSTVKMLK